MTNFVEQMMETAGVNLMLLDCERCGAQRFALGQCVETDCKRSFPDFTAEKQLELIKLIAQKSILKMLSLPISKNWEISVGPSGKYGSNIDFTQALAQLTTELMNANELDKEKVKEVLQC